MKRVVITGIGIISSIGIGVDSFWRNCLDGKANVTYIPEEWNRYRSFKSKIWTPLPVINFAEYELNRTEEKQMDKSQMLALGATNLSLKDAKIVYKLINKRRDTFSIEDLHGRAGVFIGTGVGGSSSIISNFANYIYTPIKEILPKELHGTIPIPDRFNPFTVPMSIPNACSATIGIKYSVNGPNYTFCTACASGTFAIGHAFKAIKSGEVDFSITGGVEYLGDSYGSMFCGFDILKALISNCVDPQTANRPFDLARSGFLFSEGGACILILEEMEHALKRNARIYAELVAYAESFDAYNIVMPEPNGTKIRSMIYEVLNQAHLKPENIDYINTHGTGTQANDAIEAKVIKDIFGKRPLLNSTKSLLGHTMGASGAIETAVTALSIHHQTTHACKNLENPVEDINFVRKTEPFSIKYALTHSFAFGGHNAGLILKRYD